MVQRHDSTPAQRAKAVCQLIAQAGDYGVVTHISHDLGVSRQTLYTWMERGGQAVEAAFLPLLAAPTITPPLERQILTLLVEGHASVRGNELRRSKLRGINGKAAKRSQQAAGNVPIEIQRITSFMKMSTITPASGERQYFAW